MFRRTQMRLTLQNAAVFLLMVSILGSSLYWYMEKQSYDKIDRSLLLSAQLEEARLLGVDLPAERTLDPLVGQIIWDEKHRVVYSRIPAAFLEKIEQMYPSKADGKVHTLQVEGFTFRSLAISIETPHGVWVVQSIRNIDAEIMTLQAMRTNIIIGCILAAMVALVAGYLLARRALVPIRQSWEAQQQFVADASHELRTPLSVIQMRTELLLKNPEQTVRENSDDISVIYRETRRIRKLVADLLTLARSDSNQLQLDRQLFRLDDLAQEVSLYFTELAELDGLSFGTRIDPNLWCKGDRERIHQLLVILLDNALTYTSDGGSVQFSCYKKGHTLIMEVADTGAGIAEKDLPRIFDRFYRGDQARNRAKGGTGLGLSIAKWIVDEHRGQLSVASVPDKGTAFTVKLTAAAGKTE
ncbi:sensor histidine kinase [Desmospora profundinema]|uniref:histidine kinase n=1 Tax=Desmospora profundinema TaxID=1571184 RepID=A0ABU1IPM2_9BACL|nr:HAMP domain-containing sensor histidine kinase [Desmospora profundinema]MDR6226688.1 signal transduction histidine kinase [Desmospora profundinema]